jgi:hypothetical protein
MAAKAMKIQYADAKWNEVCRNAVCGGQHAITGWNLNCCAIVPEIFVCAPTVEQRPNNL